MIYQEFPTIEGETPAERRKRIKAIKSGQAPTFIKSDAYQRFQ